MTDGLFNKDCMLALFKKKSKEIDPTIASFVGEKIVESSTDRSGGYQRS